jgi:aminoglycoside/choline kinase family phosphotransferase
LSEESKELYIGLWADVLNSLPYLGKKIVLRDYHVENLMHLAERDGIRSLGILDFQDSVIGSPIYDIVSLLEDARHDVSFDFAEEIFDYYLEKSGINKDNAYLAYDILGAQRNIRILGVFARKKIRDGNDVYLQYIPRVLKYIERDLQNPIFSSISEFHRGLVKKGGV